MQTCKLLYSVYLLLAYCRRQVPADACHQLFAEPAAERLGGARLETEPGRCPRRPQDPDAVGAVAGRQAERAASTVRGPVPPSRREAADAALRAAASAAAAVPTVRVQRQARRTQLLGVRSTRRRQTRHQSRLQVHLPW